MPEFPVRIVAECYADTLLISFLLNTLTVQHAFGISEVAKLMENAVSDEPIIGVVDNDKEKRVPLYLRDFEPIENSNRIIYKRKPNTNQTLIVLDKAVESFLLWNAEQVGFDVATLGFSTVPKLLGRRLKYDQLDADSDYIALLNALYTRQAPGFLTLEQILNDLITT